MKYLRIYISLVYLIIFSVLYTISNIREIEKFHPWGHFDLSYDEAIPFLIYMIIGLIITIIFFVILLRIKNNFLFYSILCLAILIPVIQKIITELISNTPESDIFIFYIIGFIVPIGLIILSLYFRDKYKKSLK